MRASVDLPASLTHCCSWGEAGVLRLRTFGGLSIERTDGPSPSAAATAARRRLAVLAAVAASGPRGIARDKLLALFWPEADTDRARHALDQTLYALKRDAGGDTIVLGREELTINPSALQSDVAEFEAAIARGDHEAAAALYAAPFLDGVYVPGAPGFDQWVEDARARITRDVERALENLAAAAAARGDHASAAQWWQRLAAMDIRKTRVVIALMTELAVIGDRAGALRHAQIYDTLMRDDLGAEPNPAVAALAEKLRREPALEHGPAIEPPVANAAVVEPPDMPAQESAATPSARARSGWLRSRLSSDRRVAVAVGVLVAIGLISAAGMLASRRRDAPRQWIVLAKFENRTGEPIFDRALDAALATGLEQSAYVNLFPDDRIRWTLARMERPSTESGPPRLDEALAREVAQRDGIHMVVAAAIDRVDSSYIVSARLVDANTAATIAAERQVAKRRSDVIGAMDGLVRSLRRDIGESASALKQHDLPLPFATTRSLDALRKYADGIAADSAGDTQAAIALWEQAVADDSNFALAHAALGVAYYFGNDRPRGDAHFDRALQLVDRLSDRERWHVRAVAESWRGNREQAIELRRALLAAYPDDPTAWGAIGYDYLRLGRLNQAIDAYRRQIARDSTRASDYIDIATAYSELRKYNEAIAAYREGFAISPAMLEQPNLNHEFGSMLVLAGRLPEARAVFDTMLSRGPLDRAQGERSLGLMEAQLGHYSNAIAHFREAVALSDGPEPGLTQARNRLFLASAESEKGWPDSSRAELQKVYALFHKAYFEPAFLMILEKTLVRDGELRPATEVFDSLRARARHDDPADRANLAVGAGELALANGQGDSAVRVLESAIALDSSAIVKESLAHALAAVGNVAESARQYEMLAADVPDWYGWEPEQYGLVAPVQAGALYERLGDKAHARTAYEREVSQWSAPDSDLVSLRFARERLKSLRGVELHQDSRH
jgi:DNA-binding SARP family transcriptional activator/tetratricopeptide (TPR) repeat protein